LNYSPSAFVLDIHFCSARLLRAIRCGSPQFYFVDDFIDIVRRPCEYTLREQARRRISAENPIFFDLYFTLSTLSRERERTFSQASVRREGRRWKRRLRRGRSQLCARVAKCVLISSILSGTDQSLHNERCSFESLAQVVFSGRAIIPPAPENFAFSHKTSSTASSAKATCRPWTTSNISPTLYTTFQSSSLELNDPYTLCSTLPSLSRVDLNSYTSLDSPRTTRR